MNLIDRKFYNQVLPKVFNVNGIHANLKFLDSTILNMNQKKELLNVLPKLFFQDLVYRGSSSNFSHKDFLQSVKGKSPTLCVSKTVKGHLFGMFTDLEWSNIGEGAFKNHNSFVFKFNKDNIQVFKHRRSEYFTEEIKHSET